MNAARFVIAAVLVAQPMAAQEGDAGKILSDLRQDVAAQERSCRVVAWSVDAQQTIGAGDRKFVSGKFRGRIVLETRLNGRAHVWVSRASSWWAEQKALAWWIGEAVTDGKYQAVFRKRHGTEGRGELRAEGSVTRGRASVDGLLSDGFSHVTWWPAGRRKNRLSVMLRTAHEEGVRSKDNEVFVRIEDSASGRQTTLCFVRRKPGFALSERRDVIRGKVTTTTMSDFVRVAGRIWFPKNVVIDTWTHEGEPRQLVAALSDPMLDPQLAPGTFAIVAPPGQHFSAPGKRRGVKLSADLPNILNVVRMGSADVAAPKPPTKEPAEAASTSPAGKKSKKTRQGKKAK